jgi:two-component system, sensor histidine kinase and response regulator
MNTNADTPDDARDQPTDEALIASSRFRELADSAHDIIYGIDRTGHVSFHNSAATRLIHLGTSNLVGRHYLDLVAESGRDRVNRFYLRQMARKIPNTYLEFLAYTPDGSDLWLAQNVQLVIGEDETLGFHAVARDISERRTIEIALRESEERFRRSFDDAPIGMALVSPQGRFIRVNGVLCGLTGYEEAELLELDFQAITHRGDLDLDLDNVQRLLDGEIASYQLEKRYIHRSGREIWIQLSVSLVRDEQGRPLYFVSQIQDIDERRTMLAELARARDAALESSRMKSAFLANMSHEIRTPMNGIIGLAGLMLDTKLSAEQREYMSMIRSSAESLLGLLSNVVDVAQLEAGRMELGSTDVDVRELVDDVVAAFAAHASERGLHLSSIVYRGVPSRIEADPARLRQVLENLIGNAIKFTNEGDVLLRVRTGSDGYGRGELRFEISDTGIGMSAADVPRLFDPFTQADESPTRDYAGAGLGLAISQRLVQLMGGTIGVETVSPRGTTVWFSIPSGATETAAAEIATTPSTAIDGAPGVLVVEDNPINRLVTLGQLRRHGVGADIAADGWEALDALARRSYDLILMDCDMPELDGCAATELIRRFEAGDDHVVIVAITAQAHGEARGTCLASGMDEYLCKPVSAEQIGELLTRVTALRQEGLARKGGGATEPTLDMHELDRLGFFDRDHSAPLDAAITEFIASGDGRIAALDAALERHDADGVRREAHELSDSALSLGARRLARLLGELETWLPGRRIEGARLISRHVRRAFDAASGALRNVTRALPGPAR